MRRGQKLRGIDDIVFCLLTNHFADAGWFFCWGEYNSEEYTILRGISMTSQFVMTIFCPPLIHLVLFGYLNLSKQFL